MSEHLAVESSFAAELKQAAQSHLSRLGFPTRRDEDWKYTPTEALLKHEFKSNTDDSGLVLKSAPEGVLVLPIKEALMSHADLIKPYLGQIMPQTHGFHAQNMAFFEAGFFIYIPENVQADVPLHMIHTPAMADKMYCFRHLVIAEASSALQVI